MRPIKASILACLSVSGAVYLYTADLVPWSGHAVADDETVNAKPTSSKGRKLTVAENAVAERLKTFLEAGVDDTAKGDLQPPDEEDTAVQASVTSDAPDNDVELESDVEDDDAGLTDDDGDAALLEEDASPDDSDADEDLSEDGLQETDDEPGLEDEGEGLLAEDSDDEDTEGSLLEADGEDLLEEGGDDLLDAAVEDEPAEKAPVENASVDTSGDKPLSADEEHLNLFLENRYPSANTCGVCHPKHYDEWSVSQHAYAQLSPIYLSLNNRINELSNGSNGDFCLRCHSPVGANLGESSFMSNLDRHPASREGITCVVCHRISKAYNKASGRLALEEGGLTDPVFGPSGNDGLQKVLDEPETFRVVTDPDEPGRQIHGEAKLFDPITTSTFCGSCHDVTLFNGFRLEEAFSEYRVSPAAAKGITCQDCHMGKVQGKVSGYEQGPAAVVGGVPTKVRKITSHLFSGPDYSVIHPGIFPHNTEAAEFKTLREWLQFKHEQGWGTDKFEDAVPASYKFPEAWASIDDRYDAREILDKQFAKLELARKKRLEILKIGFLLGDVVPERASRNGLAFRVQVRNGTDGHNVPTGFTGERVVWLDVTVRDKEGTVVFRSGDRDPNGDLRDSHSSYVHAGKIKRDKYLFSLQSIFVVQNGRGGELEQVIPIPYPSFALPRVLPSPNSLIFTGEPATERNHKKGIEPNGERWASYKVSGDKLTGKGPYTATIKLRAQAVPVNLLIAMQGVGFDYGMSPGDVGRALVAGAQTLWTKKLTFDVESDLVPVGAEPSTSEQPSGPINIIPKRRVEKRETQLK